MVENSVKMRYHEYHKFFIEKGERNMDQRTLVVSCVEYYSDLKNIPANKVFISFRQSGFIDLILDSHKTFPEMDIA